MPKLPDTNGSGRSKFSWVDGNAVLSTGVEDPVKVETVEDDFMHEVDELLLEQDLLSP